MSAGHRRIRPDRARRRLRRPGGRVPRRTPWRARGVAGPKARSAAPASTSAACRRRRCGWRPTSRTGWRSRATLGFDLPGASPTLDWPAFIAHRQRYIANIHASYQQRLDAAGIALLPQRGRLVAADTVECSDGVRLRAPQILIATGGRPQRPAIPGAELGIDSDGFFHLCAAPRRVAIVGAGYIAVELAGVLQALGSHVELFVRKRGCWRASTRT